MKNILSIIKKEFFRFFKDKRMVLTTLLLPGLMIYILYSFMGDGMLSTYQPQKDYTYQVYIYNESQVLKSSMENISSTLDIKVNYTIDPQETIINSALEKLKAKEIDLVIVYPFMFDKMGILQGEEAKDAPIIALYHNSTNKNSSAAYQYFSSYYNAIEQGLANVFDLNTDTTVKYDVASDKEVSAQILSLMLPMLLIMFLFSGCMSVAPESIAGEKERGTIATLLVTPINRRDFAIGKIISLSVISLLSGLSSFLGTMLSLPKIMGGDVNISANVYGLTDYLWLLAIIISSVLLFTAIISMISAYSKSVKEATSLMTPVLICVTLLGITSMFTNGKQPALFMFLLPIYNSIQVMAGIFSFNYSVSSIILTICINAVYTCAMIFMLTKMFNSEKVMFNK